MKSTEKASNGLSVNFCKVLLVSVIVLEYSLCTKFL